MSFVFTENMLSILPNWIAFAWFIAGLILTHDKMQSEYASSGNVLLRSTINVKCCVHVTCTYSFLENAVFYNLLKILCVEENIQSSIPRLKLARTINLFMQKLCLEYILWTIVELYAKSIWSSRRLNQIVVSHSGIALFCMPVFVDFLWLYLSACRL